MLRVPAGNQTTPLYTAPPAPVSAEPVHSKEKSDAYDIIDRFLRNELGDEDYAEYSAALDLIYTSAAPSADAKDSGLTKDEIAKIAGGCMQTSTYNLFMQFVSGAIAAKEAGK